MERLADLRPVVIASSGEPKAVETATILATRLGLPRVKIVRGLHEHERRSVGWLGQEAFEARVAELFARSAELVFGEETAAQALVRFTRAVERVLAAHPEGDVVVVTHGTVMTLYLAAVAAIEPLPFWRGLALPDVATLLLPARTLLVRDENLDPFQPS
jgi:broad specificity phosphatase PhoE